MRQNHLIVRAKLLVAISGFRKFFRIRARLSNRDSRNVEINVARLRVTNLMSYMITGWQTGVSHNGRTPQRIARTGDRGCAGEAAEAARDADIQPGKSSRVVKRVSTPRDLSGSD